MPCCSCWRWLSSAAVACPRARSCRPRHRAARARRCAISVGKPDPHRRYGSAQRRDRDGGRPVRAGDPHRRAQRDRRARPGRCACWPPAATSTRAGRSSARWRSSPNLPAAGYGYARSMIAIQRPEVAVEHLRRLVAQTPSSVEALNALGVAQDLLGDHAAATETYRQALGVVPASTSVRNNLALSLALQEQFADAVDLLRPLAEGPEATRRARQNLALIYGLQGDMRAAERISRVDLGGPDLANNLAYFAAVRGIEEPSVRAAALAPEQMLDWRAEADPQEQVRAPRGTHLHHPTWCQSPRHGWCLRRPSRRHRLRALARWLPILGDAASEDAGGSTLVRRCRQLRARRLQSNNGGVSAPSTVRALSGVGRLASAGGGMEPLLVGPLASEQAADEPVRATRQRTLTAAGRCSCSALMHSEAAAWRGWSPAVRSRRMGWALVVLGEVAFDGGLEVDHRVERIAPEAAGQGGEEGLDRVQPSSAARSIRCRGHAGQRPARGARGQASWKVQRGCRSSQAMTLGCWWLAWRSRITCTSSPAAPPPRRRQGRG